MARCHTCNKGLGIGLFSKWVRLDGYDFCPQCADEWKAARRQREFSAICQGRNPVEAFGIPRVRTRNPDRPGRRELLLGRMSFTDKGVCFVQLATTLQADPGLGIAFGLIGAAIADSQARRSRREAYAAAEQDVSGLATDYMELLRRSERLLSYPGAEITRLKLSGSYLEIRTAMVRKGFRLDAPRRERKQYKMLIDAYKHAIESRADPVQHCKELVAALGASSPGQT